MNVTGWRAWYVGGRVYDSKTTAWADLPDDGVIQIYLYMDRRDKTSRMPYRRGMAGSDYYWHVPGESVYGCCDASEMTPGQIAERYPGALIKRGRWVSQKEYDAAIKESFETRFL